MHDKQTELWRHDHVFNEEKKGVETRTLVVVIITLVTMAAEIFFGWLTHSMALFADGWHMGTHAFALGISLLAYRLARRYARDNAFSFGAWKIEILGAYTSAIVMALVGLFMIYASIALDPSAGDFLHLGPGRGCPGISRQCRLRRDPQRREP
ncbi:MAG: cation transporter [Syntrophaceae bacterium]|nr:cation transporter [Syntrophaceae bacterium]